MNAADVDTVVVAGRVLMQGRKPRRVESEAILEDAGRELTLALERTGLGHLTHEPSRYWSSTSSAAQRYPMDE